MHRMLHASWMAPLPAATAPLHDHQQHCYFYIEFLCLQSWCRCAVHRSNVFSFGLRCRCRLATIAACCAAAGSSRAAKLHGAVCGGCVSQDRCYSRPAAAGRGPQHGSSSGRGRNYSNLPGRHALGGQHRKRAGDCVDGVRLIAAVQLGCAICT